MINKTLTANIRPANIKAHRLRKKGYIPGVIYGQEHESTPIMIEGKSLNRLLREAGENVFFEIAMENDMRPVRLREVQRDPVTKDIVHIDAQIIDKDQKVRAYVPIRIEGSSETDRRGVAIQRQKATIQVEGLARHIPTHINVIVKGLKQGASIRVGDLEISEELSILDSRDDIVLSAVKNSRLGIEETFLEEEMEHRTNGDEDQQKETEETHRTDTQE